MQNKINKGKCEAWIDMFIAIEKMARGLTDEEIKYIEAFSYKRIGELKLKIVEGKSD